MIYPGIDERFRVQTEAGEIANTRRKYHLEEDPYILCMGPWVQRKNLGVVLSAFSQLVDDIPQARLVITGQPARGMRNLSLQDAFRGISCHARERVHALGHLPFKELRAIVRGAEVLAYPSLFEGFGLPPLEAMSAGVPAIVSDTPAVVEAVGEAALVARADYPAEWREALRQVLNTPHLGERLISSGKKRSEEFTWERCVRETAQVYTAVAQGRKQLKAV